MDQSPILIPFVPLGRRVIPELIKPVKRAIAATGIDGRRGCHSELTTVRESPSMSTTRNNLMSLWAK